MNESDYLELNYGDLNPLYAMETALRHLLRTNFKNFLEAPNSEKFIKAIAHMTESQLLEWVNLKTAGSKDLNLIKDWEKRARDIQNSCRKKLNLDEVKSPIN